MTTREELARQIFEVAHLTGTFRLRSGGMSNEYFDKYRFAANPRILKAIAEHLKSRVPRGIDALAGLELGAIPIVTMLSQETGLPALFVRKKAKDYGTCRIAEGGEVSGRRLLVIEDVVTSGGQILESVKMLRHEGADVKTVLCVIDRESGGREHLAANGLALNALFTASELKSLAASPARSAENKPAASKTEDVKPAATKSAPATPAPSKAEPIKSGPDFPKPGRDIISPRDRRR